ncbi:coactosin-like protein isoform X1 [Orcinus orca]|uniref:coactosin-like protein isoform X1 n=1 Tax=Orcinus orca TaxID=9733 RepID=UPI00211275C1|nr:coactosin-like protein isoform X1 [Orcinus orca]
MATKIDKEACRTAYNLVRDDGSAVIWVTFKYDGSTIVPGEQGEEYQDFIQQCTEFRQRVCDQRPEGAGGRFHQERAQEGGRSQLRRPDGVAPAPRPLPKSSACSLGEGPTASATSPPGRGDAMRGSAQHPVRNPAPLPASLVHLPRPSPRSSWNIFLFSFFLSFPPFLF